MNQADQPDHETTRPDPRRGASLRLLVRVLTPLFILGLATGAFLDYHRSTSRLEEQFNDRQLFMAYQAAQRLSEVFREVDKLMGLMGLMTPVAQTSDKHERIMSAVLAQLQEHGAIGAARLDAGGELAQTAGFSAAQVRRLLPKLSACKVTRKLSVEGPLRSKLSTSGWVLITTMKEPEQPGARGCVMIVMDWGHLQVLIRRMARYGANTYSWVLDQEGRLIIHPEHRQQLGVRALVPGKDCGQCHSSFDIHKEMTTGTVGTGRIRVKGQEPKLVAFTPVQVGLNRWSLAVATPASHVTSGTRRDLWSTLVFTGAIMLVMVAGALLLDREARRRIRAASRFSNVLEEEVKRRTEELAGLYERLNALQTHHTRLERVAVAGEMASVVAHEIRTPLNVLSINAQMLNHKLGKLSIQGWEEAQQVLDTLETEIHRINKLVQENLLVHVRGSPVELKPLQIDDVLLDSVRFMEPEAARNGVDLQHTPGLKLPAALADESKLRQVLLNIILNAIQATSPDGEVFMSAAAEGDRVIIRIHDTGPGLDPKDLDQVFKPFMTTKKHGTGLGLAICARLVKEMGGSINFCTDESQGACFQVTLPTAPEEV